MPDDSNSPDPDALLGTAQAAYELRLKPDTIRWYIRTGRLPATRVGRRGHLRIRRGDLARLANQGADDAAAEEDHRELVSA